jgi:RNA polymerase sigma factor for flagellar operon FliA
MRATTATAGHRTTRPTTASRTKVGVARKLRDDYVTRYYWCIEKVAKRLARRLPSHIDVDDLISAGAIGLMEAAERYDPKKCDRFEAFAEVRIRGAMLDELRARDTLTRDMRRVSNELRNATAKLSNQLGRTPADDEIAHDMGVSLQQLHARRSQLSGASVVGLDDAGPDFLDRTADQDAEDPCELAARRQLFARLTNQIAALPERMQQVLSLYYAENLNLKEIGVVMGVTESRVCQLHGEATKRLRTALGHSFTDEYAA